MVVPRSSIAVRSNAQESPRRHSGKPPYYFLMTIEQLRKAINPGAFRAFTIRLADGQAFHVDHPEWVYVAPKAERTFVVADKVGTYSVLDPLLVTTLEFSKTGKPRQSRRKSA